MEEEREGEGRKGKERRGLKMWVEALGDRNLRQMLILLNKIMNGCE